MQWNAEVKELLEKQMWYLATQGERPNVVPVAFKGISPEGELLVGDVFLHTTLENLQKDANIAVAVSDEQALKGYQIKGTARYVTEGPAVEHFRAMVEAMFHGAATAKGALVIAPAEVIVTTPGADCGKRL